MFSSHVNKRILRSNEHYGPIGGWRTRLTLLACLGVVMAGGSEVGQAGEVGPPLASPAWISLQEGSERFLVCVGAFGVGS